MIQFYKTENGFIEHDVILNKFIEHTEKSVTELDDVDINNLQEISWNEVDSKLFNRYNDGYRYVYDDSVEYYRRLTPSGTEGETYSPNAQTFLFHYKGKVDRMSEEYSSPISRSEWMDLVSPYYEYLNNIDKIKVASLSLDEIGYLNEFLGDTSRDGNDVISIRKIGEVINFNEGLDPYFDDSLILEKYNLILKGLRK